ncbi:MAG: GNAT family N-acetyltransferase [Alphaproteobacteria bacterium]|jgi:GNAT superfamily N-acetyltransferase|nr:GNAT family N-acetyltransferase [Alphaproteobacteria bacterium]MDP6813961.1 GNAT family N-acetyltransferase [Alphaproteobacteria bacterium]
MTVTTRRAEPGDLDDLVRLSLGMETHYEPDGPPEPDEAAARLKQNLFESDIGVSAILAFDDGNAAGVAFICPLFPADRLGTSLYLKDVFVSAGMRGRGIGRTLLRAVIRHARDNGHTRVDWSTMSSNTGAQRLYRDFGARQQEQMMFRVLREDFAARLEED